MSAALAPPHRSRRRISALASDLLDASGHGRCRKWLDLMAMSPAGSERSPRGLDDQ